MIIKRFHIGEIVRDLVRQKGLSDARFANLIGMQRQNVKKMVFEKHGLDTDLLCTISEVLECNFFDYYKSNRNDYKELHATISIEMGQEKQDKTITFHFGNNNVTLTDN
jgi:plasmid maintenance system antidote protein VapI